MVKHLKIYKDFFGIAEDQLCLCEICSALACEVHHIEFRSHGGKDDIMNLMGLCRGCHNRIHAFTFPRHEAEEIHERRVHYRTKFKDM